MYANKKIYALYLPQYHSIPENDEWWGKGYTEWVAVKNAKPYFKGHCQPQEPLNNNYYDLSDTTGAVWQWQADLAKNYGIDGFCIYHYWFENGKKLLEKPMEILLKHKEIDIGYFACWANEPWLRTWYKSDKSVLIDQKYGDEREWEEHYYYLAEFFKDNRYLKINGKPVVAIYKTSSIENLDKMLSVWNELSIKDGFNGIYLLGAKTAFEPEKRKYLLNGEYLFEPAYTMHYQYSIFDNIPRAFSRFFRKIHNKIFNKKVVQNMENMRKLYKRISLPSSDKNLDMFYGICPSWDNTPRKQEKGTVFKKSNPNDFKKRLAEMIKDSNAGNLIMINAWNEWGEGAFLEPSVANRYAHLEAVKEAKEGIDDK